MKWFKHFTDNHRGRSMQFLFDEMGHTGLSSWYVLMEICAEKLDRKADKNLEEVDCLLEFHARVVRQSLRISPATLQRLLDICQQLGLLKYEFSTNSLKISMPILLDLLDYDAKKSRQRRAKVTTENRLDKNRIEKNREDTDTYSFKSPTTAQKRTVVSDERKELNRKVWESYAAAYQERYKTDPARNATVNGQISKLAERLGKDAIEVIEFYVFHNESFYVRKMHPVGMCLQDAEGLLTQWKKGRAITSQDVRMFEKNTNHQQLINDLKEGKI